MAFQLPIQNPLDLNKRVAIGVSIPFNQPYVFNLTYTTVDQLKSNIINYILTNKGERVLNPNFGSNLRQLLLFETLTEDNLQAIKPKLISDIQSNFPTVTVIDLNFVPIYDENAVQLNLNYTVYNNNPQTIQITF
jgi:phage baseplate assembly protein W